MNIHKRLEALEERLLIPDVIITPICFEVRPACGKPATEMFYATLNGETIERTTEESEQGFRDRIDADYLKPLVDAAKGQRTPSIPVVMFSGEDSESDSIKITNARKP